jgi:hypothetical protein
MRRMSIGNLLVFPVGMPPHKKLLFRSELREKVRGAGLIHPTKVLRLALENAASGERPAADRGDEDRGA